MFAYKWLKTILQNMESKMEHSDMQERIFSGKWITNNDAAGLFPIDVFHRQLENVEIKGRLTENLHVLFRKKFTSYGNEPTTIFITADDYYKLYINGQFVTQGPAPGFPFHYYYNEIDITPFMKKGENIIAVHTYYQGLINRVWVSGDDRHGLLFDIVQKHEVIAKSDDTVKMCIHTGYESLGTTGYKTQFLERYDCRDACIGFEHIDYDDSSWEDALIHQHAEYSLFLQPTKQLEFERIEPVVVKKNNKGIFVDFGKVYVGYVFAVAEGNCGDIIGIQCGQELTEESEVRFEIRANCRYEEEWILSGAADELKQYDYKAFRYVQFLVPEGVTFQQITLLSRHYPFELKKILTYKDDDLQHIWDLCVNTLKYGVQEVIQDCMDREKGQYLGDGAFSSTALAILTGDTSIMEKLIDDALRTDFINEGLMTCSPCSFMQEIAEYPLMLPQLFLWHWQLKRDISFLEKRYEKVCSVIAYYGKTYGNGKGLIGNLDKWCVVDWPKESRDGYDFDLTQGKVTAGIHNVINAYYIGAVKGLNILASILNRKPFMDTAKLEKAYVESFYDSDKKLFRDTPETEHISLPANAFALMYNLCPDKETEENIVQMIFQKKANQSAFFTTFASMCGLIRIGKKEECLQLLRSPDRWLNMLKEDATVTFEAWGKDVKWNTSLFHLCYSYAILFLSDWGLADILEEYNHENYRFDC